MAPTPAPAPNSDPQTIPQSEPVPLPEPGPATTRTAAPRFEPATQPPGEVYRSRTGQRSRSGGVRRRRRHKGKGARLGLAILAAVALIGVGGTIAAVRLILRHRTEPAGTLAGYISDPALVDREYRRYYGRPTPTRAPRQEFQHAADLVRTRNFAEAAGILEAAAEQAAVPVVFNDLGVLYSQLHDRPRAGTAFRQALARDAHYPAVLANLNRLAPSAANLPVLTSEVEPNNTHFTANPLTVGTPVEGEIPVDSDDIDFFRFSFPPGPRDVVAVQVTNHGSKLVPRLDVYDGDMSILDWGTNTATAGHSVSVFGSAKPESPMYVEVSGIGSAGGRYQVSVRALKAFDEYEPNDDIFHARPIRCDTPIKANIMDLDDTDFYSFRAPRSGTMTVDIHNDSVTLIPGVQLHGPDFRSKGFGPTLRNPGESLSATMHVESGQVYYVQVWPQASTSGAYTLTVH